MYRATIEQFAKAKEILNLVDTEYFDITVNQSVLLVIANNQEIFVMATFPVSATANATELSFRVKKKMFLALVDAGILDIEDLNNNIKLTLFDKGQNIKCKLIFTKQIVSKIYTDKLAIIPDIHNGKYPQASLTNANNVIKFAKTLNSIISISEGVLGVTTNAFNIYQPTETTLCDCISGKSLSSLLKLSNVIYRAQNYLCSFADNLTVICTKCRGYSNANYQYAKSKGSKYIATVDLSNLFEVMLKTDVKSDIVVIDFSTNLIELEVDSVLMEIPLKVSKVQIAPNCTAPVIKLRTDMMKMLNTVFKEKVFTFKAKHNFNVLAVGDLEVHW